jgi:hypothetical protein
MTTHENAPPDTSEDVVKATLRGRVCTAALVLCLIVLIAFFQLFVLPLLNNILTENPSAQDIRMLKWILAGFAVSGILPALYMIATGWKTRCSARFPLAGAWVLRDTKVKHGADALRIGAFCIASGIIACMICVGATTYIWIMFDRLVPHHNLPQGVIILEQGAGAKP